MWLVCDVWSLYEHAHLLEKHYILSSSVVLYETQQKGKYFMQNSRVKTSALLNYDVMFFARDSWAWCVVVPRRLRQVRLFAQTRVRTAFPAACASSSRSLALARSLFLSFSCGPRQGKFLRPCAIWI